jgi:hypothetical protein
MKLVSPTELARIITATTGEAFTRQAAHKAIGAGLIPFTLSGKKKLVDLDDPAVQVYVQHDNRQREAVKKNGVEPEPAKIPTKKPAKKKSPSKLPDRKQPEPPNLSELDPFTIKHRAMIADMRKKEAQAKILEKNYLPTDFIEHDIYRYTTKLNTIIERMASVYISEVGQKILEAGEVKPEHIETFIAMCLKAIDATRKKCMEEIRKYEP